MDGHEGMRLVSETKTLEGRMRKGWMDGEERRGVELKDGGRQADRQAGRKGREAGRKEENGKRNGKRKRRRKHGKGTGKGKRKGHVGGGGGVGGVEWYGGCGGGEV